MPTGGINAILALVSAALPAVSSLVVAIKNIDGSVNVGVVLSQANATDTSYIQTVSAWLASHPAATPATPVTPAPAPAVEAHPAV